MELMPRTQKLVLIEDDGSLRMLLARCLRENGFEVAGFRTAAEFAASSLASMEEIDLVILDIMLPGTNGLDLCRTIRQSSTVPIIFISARASQTDRIVGLEIGADDYLVKPVDPDELVARVRAVLRRASTSRDGSNEAGGAMLYFDGWRLDPRRRELFAPEGERISVSEAEFDLLVTLASMPQRVVSRTLLLENSRGRQAGTGDRSVDVLVSRLRQKLAASSNGSELIRTVRGLGYVFVPEVTR